MNAPQPVVDVCLISPGLPSSNPRLVKEAAALTSAGYRVHCIVGDYPTPLRQYDEQLLKMAGASFTRVGLGSRWDYRCRRATQLAAGWLAKIIPGETASALACSTQVGLLTQAACQIRAKLYIGHTLTGLPAAVWSARRSRGLAGFDAEDFHGGETGDPVRDQLAQQVESKFLPQCRHLTAAAPLIAEEYHSRYGVRMASVLNTFPLPAKSIPLPPAGPPWSLYWFSQTIGPGRGLEQIIRGLGRCSTQVRLALRGIIADGYRKELEQLANSQTRPVQIAFLPPAHPDDMIPLASQHHLGLSIELRSPLNRDICLTNKLFTFLAAGIPQLLSRTRAHEAIAPALADAALLVDLDDPEAVARGVDEILANSVSWKSRADHVRKLAVDRFHWEFDQSQFLNQVSQLLQVPVSADASGKHSAQMLMREAH